MSLKSVTKIFKENQYILYTHIVDKIFFLVFFMILARSLDLNSYGRIAIVFAFANLMVALFSFGFPIHLQREVAYNKINPDKLFMSIFSINLFLSIPYIIISFVLFKIIYPNFEFQLLLFLVVIIIWLSNECLFLALLKGLKKYKNIFIITLVSRLITTSIVVIIWLYHYSNYTIIYTFIVGNLLFLFAIFLTSRQYLKMNNLFHFNFEDLKILLLTVYPIWLTMIFNYFYDKIDVFIISKILDFEQLSYYSIAYGALKSATIGYNFLLIGGLTKVTLFTNNKKGLRVFLIKYSQLFLILSIIIFLFLFFGAKDILILLYTEKFMPSTYILQVLSFAIIPLAFNSLTGITMNGIGLYKENMYITMSGLLFNFILNIIAITKYGIIGAAYVTILTELIILSGDIYVLKKRNKI